VTGASQQHQAPVTSRCEEYVVEVLNAEIRPLLKIHGGSLDLVRVTNEGEVHLEFQGACRGCAFQSVTYAIAIRQRLLEIPEVRGVVMNGVRLSDAALQRTAAMYKGYSFRIAGQSRPVEM
jgi:Fe-S cluster biogenesis protein NfuA